jgi:MalT-like TPR region
MRATRSTWPGSSRNAGARRSRCTSWPPSTPTPPPDVVQAETHYQPALALASELGMRPLQAHGHRGLGTLYAKTGRPEQAHTELSAAIDLYRSMDMTFWLPQVEAVLARVEGHDV